MAEKTDKSYDSDIRFTDEELAALRMIVMDWINEEIVQPPFPPDVASAIEKLGISPPDEAVPFTAPDSGQPVPVSTLTAPIPRQLDDPSDPAGAANP